MENRSERFEHRSPARDEVVGSADEHLQRAGLDLGQAAENGRIEQSGNRRGQTHHGFRSDRRHLDHRRVCVDAGGDTVPAFGDGLQRLRIGHHHEDGISSLRRLGRSRRSSSACRHELVGLRRVPIPDDDAVSLVQQAAGDATAHRPEPDDSERRHTGRVRSAREPAGVRPRRGLAVRSSSRARRSRRCRRTSRSRRSRSSARSIPPGRSSRC